MGDTTSDRYLRFSLGQEEFGIPLLTVREVIAMPQTTPVPFAPSHFKGIMNVRGQIISVMDLRAKLQIKPKEQGELAVVICDFSGITIGLIVDNVSSVMKVAVEELSPPPAGLQSKASEFISSIFRTEDKLILILELAKALSIADYQAIEKASAKKAA